MTEPLCVRVSAVRPSWGQALAEVWSWRELLGTLVWREIRARYKHMALGMGWMVLEPLLMMAVIGWVFGSMVPASALSVPYPLFVLAGLIPWQFFSHAFTRAGTSLVANEHVLTKIYFPRALIPVALVLSSLIDLLVACIVLIGALAWYHTPLRWELLALPGLMLLACVAAIGIGMLWSSIEVRYRDVRCLMPFAAQLWFFATPVIYARDMLTGWWRTCSLANPMTSVVEGFRWAVLGQRPLPVVELVSSGAVIAGLLLLGGIVFHAVEPDLADRI